MALTDKQQREPVTDWRPISDVRTVRYGTIADLKMRSGRTYRAVYGFRGRCCVWWPLPGQARSNPIGTCEPKAFAIQAVGTVANGDWRQAAKVGHAAVL